MAPLRPAMVAYRQTYPASRNAYLADVCTAARHGCPAFVGCFVRRDDRLEMLDHLRKEGIAGPLKLIYIEASLDVLLQRNTMRKPPHKLETLQYFYRTQQ